MEVDDADVSPVIKKKRIRKVFEAASAAAPICSASIAEATATTTTATTSTLVPVATPQAEVAQATFTQKIYYRAQEDNETYAVSSISIDNAVVNLNDLTNVLMAGNKWPESSRVKFYIGVNRLALTTSLSDCLLDNTFDKPLTVIVLTAAYREVAAVSRQERSTGKSRRLFFFQSEIKDLTAVRLLMTSYSLLNSKQFIQ